MNLQFKFSWLRLVSIIAFESDRFGKAPLPILPKCADHNELIGAHEREELSLRPSVDLAIQVFARDRKWPDRMTGNVQYFIQQRLSVAFVVSNYLAAPDPLPETTPPNRTLPQAPDTFDERSALEWVLIAGWHSVGSRFWLNHQRIRLELLHNRRLPGSLGD